MYIHTYIHTHICYYMYPHWGPSGGPGNRALGRPAGTNTKGRFSFGALLCLADEYESKPGVFQPSSSASPLVFQAP